MQRSDRPGELEGSTPAEQPAEPQSPAPRERRRAAPKPAPAQEQVAAPAGPPARAQGAAPRERQRAAPKPAPAQEQPTAPVGPPRLFLRYRQEVAPRLQAEFGYANPMAVPKLEKVVLNIGLGEALTNANALENAGRDLGLIAGQKPVVNRARKSIATFKLREGMPIGLSVTLRSRRMYEFFDRLVNASLPRIRDFRGVSRKSFDGRGNFAMGIREHVIFSEIDYNTIDRIRGFQVIIVTTAKSDQEALRLLELLGMPFTREGAPVAAA